MIATTSLRRRFVSLTSATQKLEDLVNELEQEKSMEGTSSIGKDNTNSYGRSEAAPARSGGTGFNGQKLTIADEARPGDCYTSEMPFEDALRRNLSAVAQRSGQPVEPPGLKQRMWRRLR